MSIITVINELSEKFKDAILEKQILTEKFGIIKVDKNTFLDVIDYAYNALGGHLLTMAGTDLTPIIGKYVLDYVIGYLRDRTKLIVRLELKSNEKSFPSAVLKVPCLDYYEREVMEMLGLTPEGHPNPKRLLLPEDWPSDATPLNKSFEYNKRVETKGETYPLKKGAITIGPVNPELEEPIRLILYAENGKIKEAIVEQGFNYRGIEKLAEGKLNYEKIHFLAERICGICGYTHSECYVQAIEKIAGEPPERAKYLRTIMLEVERIHSHLLWLAIAAKVIGYVDGALKLLHIRELIMDVAELVTGSRKMYGLMTIGGVRRDIDDKIKEKVKENIKKIESEFRSMLEAQEFKDALNKLKGIGILSKEDAKKLSVVGPTARASGIKTDIRKDYPYEAYKEVDFEIQVVDTEDVYGRAIVRAYEVFESIKIVEQCLDNLPEGPIINDDIEFIPEMKLSIGMSEAPRGADVHYLITGRNNTVYRWRVRAPTYANIQAVPKMLEGEPVDNALIVYLSIDPCIACCERVIVIENGKRYYYRPKFRIRR